MHEILQSFSKISKGVEGQVNVRMGKDLVGVGGFNINRKGSGVPAKLHVTGFVAHHDGFRKVNRREVS